jgi:Spy/CpxP family protein refolding chaperone
MKKVAIFMLIAVFTLTGMAAAKGSGRRGPEGGPGGDGQKGAPGMFWEKERVAQALSLTEAEKAILTEIHIAHRETVQSMREELRKEREAFREILESEELSSSAARKHFKEAEKVRSRIHEKRFELQIEKRQLLGQERFVKLREMERRAKEKRRGRQ